MNEIDQLLNTSRVNRKFILRTMDYMTGLMKSLPVKWKKDKAIGLAAVKNRPSCYGSFIAHAGVEVARYILEHSWKEDYFRRLPAEVSRNREFVLEACSRYGHYLEMAEDFQGDREIVMAAIQNNGDHFSTHQSV